MTNVLAPPGALAIQFGSQTTGLIGRRSRENRVRATTLEPKKAAAYLERNPVQAVILSGGFQSVYDKNALKLPKGLLSLRRDGRPVPILCICYGHHLITHELGGKVAASGHVVSGRMLVNVTEHPLFAGTPARQIMWENHGDVVVEPPSGFSVIATSGDGRDIEAMADDERRIYTIQAHPEVDNTEFGRQIIANFLLNIANCDQNWDSSGQISMRREAIEREVGHGIAIAGASGGVDSGVSIALAVPVLGPRLHPFTIDSGLLREGEVDVIRENVRATGTETTVVDAKHSFYRALAPCFTGKAIRGGFTGCYLSEFKKFGLSVGATHMMQGTNAADRAESGTMHTAKIKDHHNELAEARLRRLFLASTPIVDLFKDEIRDLARDLGLPESVASRHPFPGPGFSLRNLRSDPGFLVRLHKRIFREQAVREYAAQIELIRWGTVEYERILGEYKVPGEDITWFQKIAQPVLAYTDMRTTGIKGDGPAYEGSFIVRAVMTQNFMTVTGVHFPDDIWQDIRETLTRPRSIIRVLEDSTDKPPATTEFL